MTAIALVVASLALAVSLVSLAAARAAVVRAKTVTRVVRTHSTPSGVVTFDGPLSGDDFRRFREEFEKRADAEPLTDTQVENVAKRFRAAWAAEPRRPL